MKKLVFLLLLATLANSMMAQLPEHMEGKMTYPVFDFDPWVGVIKKKTKVLKYNKDLNYKIVIDMYDGLKDSTKVMRTLKEVARTYNLNVANGVPKRKLKVAVVIHGGAIRGILNDESYQLQYGVPNPNIAVIKEMKKAGIEFYVCSQILSFRQVPEEDVAKEIDIALSAKTALTTLGLMGYIYMSVNQD